MTTVLHSQDFHEWTQQQAQLLKSGQLFKLDVEHLIEELENAIRCAYRMCRGTRRIVRVFYALHCVQHILSCYDNETRDLIAEHSKEDIALFGYDFEGYQNTADYLQRRFPVHAASY